MLGWKDLGQQSMLKVSDTKKRMDIRMDLQIEHLVAHSARGFTMHVLAQRLQLIF